MTVRKYLMLPLLILIGVSLLSAQQNRQREINLASRLVRAQEYERALAMFSRLYSEGYQSIEVTDGLIRCYYGLHQYDKAIHLLNKLIKQHPERYNYKIDLGRAFYMNNNKTEAMRIWQEVIESKPPDIMKYRFTASAMAQLHLFDEAIEVYKKAIESFKNQEIMYRDIAVLYRGQLDYKNAAYYFLKYYEYNPKRFNDIYTQILYMVNDKDALPQITAEIEKYLDNNEDVKISELLGGLYLRQNDLRQAYTIYDNLYKEDKNINHLLNFSREAELKGEYQYAVNAYQQILYANLPERTELDVKLNLAKCYYHLAKKGYDDDIYIKKSVDLLQNLCAVQEYKSLRINAIEFYAEVFLQYYNDIDGAIHQYNTILQIEQNRAVQERIFLKLANAYFLKNDLDRALIYYSKITSGRNIAYVLYKKGNIQYYRGYFKRAKDLYNQALGKAGSLDSIANNILQQIMLIDQFSQDSTVLAEFSNAERLQYQGRKSQAAAKYYDLFKLNKDISKTAGLRSAHILKNLAKYEDAVKILNEFLQIYPNDYGSDEALFLLGQCQNKLRNYDQALDAYKRIMIDFPNSFYIDRSRENARMITELINNKH
jgi:tetratricopeptide (TPR) repeat protein